MADIELVINIPEDEYRRIKEGKWEGNPLADYIENGTPLPKGHGRLIDADVVDANIYDLTRSIDLDYGQISEVVDIAPTIIEADKGEE
jgi:hypothetical protein